MKQIAPHVTTLKHVQVEADKTEAARLRKKGSKVTRREYLDDTHRYVLSISGVSSKNRDDVKTMTGLVAKLENNLFFQRYINDKDKHLKRWVWLKGEEHETKNAVNAILEMRRKS